MTTPWGICRPRALNSSSEFQPRLKGNHARTAVAAQSDPEQSSGRSGGIGQGAETSLCGRVAWNAGQRHAGETEVGMVEHVEELSVESQFHTLGDRKPFREVEITPEESGTAQRVAGEISELAGLRAIASVAGSGCGIDRRDERIWIEPLDGAGLSNSGN